MAEALVSKGLATVVRYSADNDQRSSRYRDVQKLLPGRIDFFDNFSTIFGRHPSIYKRKQESKKIKKTRPRPRK